MYPALAATPAAPSAPAHSRGIVEPTHMHHLQPRPMPESILCETISFRTYPFLRVQPNYLLPHRHADIAPPEKPCQRLLRTRSRTNELLQRLLATTAGSNRSAKKTGLAQSWT